VARSLADVPLESDVPLGPDLPGVQGPPRPGRRVVPETILPETSSRPDPPAAPGRAAAARTGAGAADQGQRAQADQLVPKVGRNGGKGIGPLLPPELGPPAPETPPAVQPVADLLNAARKVAQPNPLEQLIGAGRGTAAREVAPSSLAARSRRSRRPSPSGSRPTPAR
jgi:hypothetical protein